MNRYRRQIFRSGKKKLNSSTGASLAVALLFFVFMAVVGSVILAAAASGMGRIKDEDQGNQERYALYSAANLVVNAFSGKNVFSFQGEQKTPAAVTQSGIDYFINNDTGDRYTDISSKASFNPGSAWTTEPTYENVAYQATDLAEIRYQLSEKVLKDHWKDVTGNWDENNNMYWSSIVSGSSDDSQDGKYPYQFELTGSDDWSKEAPAFKEVTVKLRIEDNLDIVGELSIHKQSDEKLSKEVTGQKYYIRIPLSSEAMINYGVEGSPELTPSQDGNYIRVHETGKIEFDNFQWADKDQAVISTKKSEVE